MTKKRNIDLGTSKEDYIASAVRALASAASTVSTVPGGSFLGELITFAIPNQRMDRFAEVLEKVMQDVEDLEERLNNPENRDLFEEAGIQSGRAVTDERKLYIANMLKNGLKNADNAYFEKKKLFSILENLNEIEIILLKLMTFEEELENFKTDNNELSNILERKAIESRKRTFYQKNSELFQNHIDKHSSTFYQNYMSNLERYGLVKGNVQTTLLGELPIYKITPLGELFLQYIEVPES